MLDEIILKFGSSPHNENLQFRSQTINIFVGPNNSGKSTLLKEVEEYLNKGSIAQSLKFSIIERIIVNLPYDRNKLFEMVQPFIESESEYSHGRGTNLSLRRYNLLEERGMFGNFNLPKSIFTDPPHYETYGFDQDRKEKEKGQIAHLFTTRLDGETRPNLVKSRDSAGYGQRAKNVLVALLQNKHLREQVRLAILDAIELYFSLDVTDPKTIKIKLSSKKPEDIYEIQWGEEAIQYHSTTHPITSYGDGIKAFVGLTIATAIPHTKFFLVDEPDAFLHPPLAKKLGVHLSRLAERQDIKMFFSTHSADFLMGCIEANQNVNIVRLTYKAGVPTARLLDGMAMSKLLDDPIMRQSNVLSGLFHEGVILTEDDMDRVFYQEINARLKDADRAFSKDCLFLNFNGKDAMYKVVKPLRAMGIPTACLLDFDFIVGKSHTRTFSRLISCASIPEATQKGLKQARQTILNRLTDEQKDDAKDKGIKSFESEQSEEIKDLLDTLAQYGIFVVPSGEVESFLPHLGEGKEKRPWFFSVMKKLGNKPDTPNYVIPGIGDVWGFMEQVSAWLSNPNRKGIPT